MLSHGFDTTTELPPERWDINAYFDPDVDAPGKTYVKLGHFIPGIDQFDSEFFGVGDAEIRAMDPHQWLSLEISYEGLAAAGYTKETLQGLECGVYVGCCNIGGNDVDLGALGPFSNIGSAYSGCSGRVSHCLSLRGPCFTVDTACSSTVVAVDSGCQAIRTAKCKTAVCAGANVQIAASIWVGFSKMRGLAFDGRCKTFDSRADGFARGEGLGACVLAPQAGVAAEVAPLAAFCGVSTNHDGRAATITAPNGTAQQRVIRSALSERGTSAEDIKCLECHGTGTALGDPIEVGSQKAIYAKGRDQHPLVLAAVKSAIGHLEGSAGVAGISKVLMTIRHKAISPNLHLEKLNPNIDLNGFNVIMPDKLLEWKNVDNRASVSSFGFSGTNGHALMEAPPQAEVGAVMYPKIQKYNRKIVKPWRDWLETVLYLEDWAPAELVPAGALDGRCLVTGTGAYAEALCKGIAGAVAAKPVDYGVEALGACLKAGEAQVAVYARLLDAADTEVPGERLEELMFFLQAVMQAPAPPKIVVVVTRGVQDVTREKFDAGSSLWGLLRSARFEMPRVVLKAVDVAEGATPEDVAKAVAAELTAPEGDLEVALTASGRQVPRVFESPSTAAQLQRQDVMLDKASIAEGAQIVSGGLGGLGLVAARQLAELGASALVLTSRSGKVPEGQGLEEHLAWIEAIESTEVHIKKCDVSAAAAVSALVKEVRDSVAPVKGALTPLHVLSLYVSLSLYIYVYIYIYIYIYI